MNCAEWKERMDAYVDAELPPAETDAFRAHLDKCAGCAASAFALAQGKIATRRAATRYAAPSDLRSRILDLAQSEGGPGLRRAEGNWKTVRPFTSRAWWRWGVALAALLLITAGLFMASRRQESRALAEFADLHVTALASANPVEVISTDRHTVKPWFQGRIPFTFDLPDLQGTPFTLVGGRVAYFHQEPGAQLVFGYQRHLISVFIFRETDRLSLATITGADQTSSFSVRTWSKNGLRYVVIGDASPSIIQELSERLK